MHQFHLSCLSFPFLSYCPLLYKRKDPLCLHINKNQAIKFLSTFTFFSKLLNCMQEGKNARRFKKLYADKKDVLVPDIFWDYTSATVLTMEWVDGVKLNEQKAIENQGLNLLELVNTGIQCSLRQLLEYGYFHADPHPGNLLATPDGKLAFLDFGMMSETPEEARFAIIGHVVHMVNRDYEAMAQDYYALDFLSPSVDVSPIVPALRGFFDDALTSTVSELNFKTIVDGLGAVLYQYPFNGEFSSMLAHKLDTYFHHFLKNLVGRSKFTLFLTQIQFYTCLIP